MAIGERIHFFRMKKKMRMTDLGMAVGFPENSSDVRIAQYEKGCRVPKEEMVKIFAKEFGVSTKALTVPDIDSHVGLMHTLFALEDMYGFFIDDIDGEIVLRLDKSRGKSYAKLFDMFYEWNRKKQKLNRGEISKEDYDNWRYNYSDIKTDESGNWIIQYDGNSPKRNRYTGKK